MMKFSETIKFSKEFERLAEKYPSLSADLEELKKIISEIPGGTGKHFAVLSAREGLKIIKARLFCRYLKGSSLRIVYCHREAERTIEFIEIFPKNEKSREDETRIKEYLKNLL